MAFNGHQEVHQRLAGNDDPLTLEEVRDLRKWARHVDEGNMRRIYVELALLNHEAVFLNKAAID